MDSPGPPVTPAGGPSPLGGPRVPEGRVVRGSLSPSRAQGFLNCPLAHRFRTVDRLPEPVSLPAVRGTVVHRVLERLFDLPAPRRTPLDALALLTPAWQEVSAAEPDAETYFAARPAEDLEEWLGSCVEVLEQYFVLEDPRRLEPAAREVFVESLLESGLLLRGVVDRVDVAPDGAVRIVDYKTGRAPSEDFEQRALFQMRFYALLWHELHGVLPHRLQLVYLGSGELLSYDPDEQDLDATRRKVEAIWAAIELARVERDWQPRRSGLCRTCPYKPLCPAFGGTPPPVPELVAD